MDEAIIEDVQKAFAAEKKRDRRFLVSIIIIAFVVSALGVTPIVLYLREVLTDIRSLGVATCQELLIDHRVENERKHFAIASNQQEIAHAQGLDAEIAIVPPEREIKSPAYCRNHGINP